MNGEFRLFDEDAFERREVVLLVEKQKRRAVVVRVNRAERERTMSVGEQQGIRHKATRPLVAILERPDGWTSDGTEDTQESHRSTAYQHSLRLKTILLYQICGSL